MWKLLAALLVPLASLVFGWIKGSRKAKSKALADRQLADARNNTAKAEAEARQTKSTQQAVSSAASIAVDIARQAKDSDSSAASLDARLEDASNRGDLDMAIHIAKEQAERAREFAAMIKEMEK